MPTDSPRPQSPLSRAAPERIRRSSLTSRITVVTTLVALLAVMLVALAALPQLRAAERQAQQQQLSQLADAAAVSARQEGTLPEEVRARLVEALQRNEVSLLLTGAAEPPPLGLSAAVLSPLWVTGRLSTTAIVDGEPVLVEGRLVTTNTGLLLVQPASVSAPGFAELVGRMILAVAIAGTVAAVAGIVLARWVTRPLRIAAQAADRLQRGDREIRLQPEGPAEVADLAVALNRLGDGLAASESRQRDFLLSVSHELRTPMTAIAGYAEALADGVVATDDVPRVAGVMVGESERLEQLIADLLDLARLGAVDFPLDRIRMDLREVAESAAEVWQDRCHAEGIHWHLEETEAPVVAVVDGRRVRQIIDNLVANALRVTPAGESIVLGLRAEAPEVLVEVRDSGPGLAEEEFAVAFEPAELYSRYRGLRSVGTGVGLALVGRLAHRMGGEATAGPAAEGGACFRVSFPMAE